MRRAGRTAAALALLAGMAGCGPGNEFGGLSRNVTADLRTQVLATLGAEVEAPPPPSRAELEALGFATIFVRLPAAPGGAPFIALVENRGRVTYVSGDRRSITLEGGQVTGTNALGTDLAGYRSDPAVDPVLRPRPPAAWPAEVTRVYRFRDGLGRSFTRAALCRPVVAAEEAVDVFGVTLTLTPVEEACRTAAHAFVNRYWIETETGRVWKAEQWLGPESGTLSYEVVRPFG